MLSSTEQLDMLVFISKIFLLSGVESSLKTLYNLGAWVDVATDLRDFISLLITLYSILMLPCSPSEPLS